MATGLIKWTCGRFGAPLASLPIWDISVSLAHVSAFQSRPRPRPSRLGRDGFPFRLVYFHIGMRDEEMPDHGLKSFRVRGNVVGIDRGHNYAGVGLRGSIAAVFADDPYDMSSHLLRQLDR